MKYKVIGWTYYDNHTYPTSKPTSAINNAVIDDIINNNYLFTGYHHQEYSGCVPVINTGEKVIYSQRGFGGIMAMSKGKNRVYDYSLYTYVSDPDADCFRLPKEYVDDSKIISKKELVEQYHIDVDDNTMAIADIKEELTLKDLKEYRYIDVGDIVILHHNDKTSKYLIKECIREKDVSILDEYYFKYRNCYENKDEIVKKYEQAGYRIVLKLEYIFALKD